MTTGVYIALICLAVLTTASATWLFVYFYYLRQTQALKNEITQLQTRLSLEQQHYTERLEDRNKLVNNFADLSQKALSNNNDMFLKLAQEKLTQFKMGAEYDLQKRETAIELLVKPIQEALLKTEKQIQEIEKDRKQHFGALSQHLEALARAQENLQGETRNLVTALRRPEVRGKWGELTLKRVVELAGMVEHCDFYEQEQVSGDNGALRPDMIVRLPGEREIVIDVKTPLDAYLNAVETQDDSVRKAEFLRHSKTVRTRVRELASKNYWNQFDKAPDFVVMFIPGEQFLSAALELDQDILEYGLQQKVIIATPTTLVALLRAVAYGWRQQNLERNADKIKELGEELYKRLGVFTEHLASVGRSLSSTLDHYNKAVGSLERQLMPGARKFEELGVHPDNLIETPSMIEKVVREPLTPSALS